MRTLCSAYGKTDIHEGMEIYWLFLDEIWQNGLAGWDIVSAHSVQKTSAQQQLLSSLIIPTCR